MSKDKFYNPAAHKGRGTREEYYISSSLTERLLGMMGGMEMVFIKTPFGAPRLKESPE